jgi:acetyl-CoA acyltransferase 2
MAAHVAGRALYIVAAKRTACGSFGGTLKDMTANDLAVSAAQAAIHAAGLKPEVIDTCVVGNVSEDARPLHARTLRFWVA